MTFRGRSIDSGWICSPEVARRCSYRSRRTHSARDSVRICEVHWPSLQRARRPASPSIGSAPCTRTRGSCGVKRAVSTGWASMEWGCRDHLLGASTGALTRDWRPEPPARRNYEIQPYQRGTLDIVRLAIEDDQRAQDRRQAKSGDKECRGDQCENWAANDRADEHQHRNEQQRDLEAAVENQAHREVGLVARRCRDADHVLDRIARDRHDYEP